MDGVLVVDKPAGMTSHDVVDQIRKRLRTRKVGHAGTLDPDATGLLLIGVGRATRFLSYAQEGPKTYSAKARFGITTTTQDSSGAVVEEGPADITREDVEGELKRFVGDIQQLPPMVSAVKVGGERLYEKARRGEEIRRLPRPVTVYELELTDFTEGERPEAALHVRCSAGTFVRTLIHDLGAALGCGAHMIGLRRTEAGGFGETDAVPLTSITRESLRPLVDAVTALPKIELDDEQIALVRHGRPLALDSGQPEGTSVALVSGGRLFAVYESKDGALIADRVMSS